MSKRTATRPTAVSIVHRGEYFIYHLCHRSATPFPSTGSDPRRHTRYRDCDDAEDRSILVKDEWYALVKAVRLVASPGELVRKVSELLGLAEPTIVLHDRNLVVAGLRSKSGRGTSAARMTARDAAHLLVAVLASPVRERQ